eukprot:Lankesteria_metandrocarpae@DN1469_c0_g1_i1.p1
MRYKGLCNFASRRRQYSSYSTRGSRSYCGAKVSPSLMRKRKVLLRGSTTRVKADVNAASNEDANVPAVIGGYGVDDDDLSKVAPVHAVSTVKRLSINNNTAAVPSGKTRHSTTAAVQVTGNSNPQFDSGKLFPRNLEDTRPKRSESSFSPTHSVVKRQSEIVGRRIAEDYHLPISNISATAIGTASTTPTAASESRPVPCVKSDEQQAEHDSNKSVTTTAIVAGNERRRQAKPSRRSRRYVTAPSSGSVDFTAPQKRSTTSGTATDGDATTPDTTAVVTELDGSSIKYSGSSFPTTELFTTYQIKNAHNDAPVTAVCFDGLRPHTGLKDHLTARRPKYLFTGALSDVKLWDINSSFDACNTTVGDRQTSTRKTAAPLWTWRAHRSSKASVINGNGRSPSSSGAPPVVKSIRGLDDCHLLVAVGPLLQVIDTRVPSAVQTWWYNSNASASELHTSSRGIDDVHDITFLAPKFTESTGGIGKPVQTISSVYIAATGSDAAIRIFDTRRLGSLVAKKSLVSEQAALEHLSWFDDPHTDATTCDNTAYASNIAASTGGRSSILHAPTQYDHQTPAATDRPDVSACMQGLLCAGNDRLVRCWNHGWLSFSPAHAAPVHGVGILPLDTTRTDTVLLSSLYAEQGGIAPAALRKTLSGDVVSSGDYITNHSGDAWIVVSASHDSRMRAWSFKKPKSLHTGGTEVNDATSHINTISFVENNTGRVATSANCSTTSLCSMPAFQIIVAADSGGAIRLWEYGLKSETLQTDRCSADTSQSFGVLTQLTEHLLRHSEGASINKLVGGVDFFVSASSDSSVRLWKPDISSSASVFGV